MKNGHSLQLFIPHVTSGVLWKFKLLVIGMFLVQIIAPFNKHAIQLSDYNSYWPTVEKQAENPFKKIEAHPKSHAANKTFRLTVPIIAKTLHLDRREILLLQMTLILPILWSILTILYRITRDKKLSSLLFIACLPLYAVISPYYETSGHLDAFAYCFLLLAMVSPRPALILLFCTLAAWCDERAFIATFWLLFWWKRNSTNKLSEYAVAASILGYVIVRAFLTTQFSMKVAMNDPDLTIFPQYAHLMPLLMFLAFGGLWVFPVMFFFQKREERFKLSNCALLLLFLVAFASSAIVWDFTRSMAFLLPMVFITIQTAHKNLTYEHLKNISTTVAIIAVLLPICYFDGQMHYGSGLVLEGIKQAYDGLASLKSVMFAAR